MKCSTWWSFYELNYTRSFFSLQTQEAAANRDTIEVVDDITEAFTLLHSAKISTITKTTTTTITPGQAWDNLSAYDTQYRDQSKKKTGKDKTLTINKKSTIFELSS